MAGVWTIKPADAVIEQIDLDVAQMIVPHLRRFISPENGTIVTARRDIHYCVWCYNTATLFKRNCAGGNERGDFQRRYNNARLT